MVHIIGKITKFQRQTCNNTTTKCTHQYYFALDSTFFAANFNKTEARPRSMLEAEAKAEAEDKHFASRSVWLKWLRIAGLFDR